MIARVSHTFPMNAGTVPVGKREKNVVGGKGGPVLQTAGVDPAVQRRASEPFEMQRSRPVGDPEALTEEEKQQVEALKKAEQTVKAHERAHIAAGAGLVQGGASYQYQTGPDGRMYAVAGEVKIDTSRERDPHATIRKMQQVRRAALAPAEPSGTDRAVAAQAAQVEAQARIELAKDGTTDDQDPQKQEGGALRVFNNPFQNLSQAEERGRKIDLKI